MGSLVRVDGRVLDDRLDVRNGRARRIGGIDGARLQEWGVPVHDDQRLFEFLILEGAQAGLSWDTILRKRDNYREAFDGFDPGKVARFSEARCGKLLQNEGIIRNRLKIDAAIHNAQAFLETAKEFGTFDQFQEPILHLRAADQRCRFIRYA